eukprot:m.76060 g.76060  ORF g.76060 m.76060 type:complete len:130 (+) comp8102_c0_seq3:177-566(+)
MALRAVVRVRASAVGAVRSRLVGTSAVLRASSQDNSDYAGPVEAATHTGSAWATSDYRNARFVHGHKEVNKHFAQDLIAAVPPTVVHARRVACDGGGGALGHPKVFINLDQPGAHSCGYCGLRFVQAEH